MVRVNLDHIPAIGRSGIVSSYLDIARLRQDGDRLVRKACRRFQGRIFRVPFINHWAVIISDPKHIDEMKLAKDEELSSDDAFEEFIQKRYTLSSSFRTEQIIHAVRNTLTRNIAAKFGEIRDEIVVAFGDCLPADIEHDWVPVVPLVAMREIIGRVSNRLFVGLPLCRNAEWLELTIDFAVHAFGNAEKIKKWPALCKSVVGWWYSPYPKAYRTARRLIGKEVEERLRAFNEGEKDLPNDLITWIIEGMPEKDRNVETVTMGIIVVNLGAIHTSSNTLAYVLLRLAAHPEYVEPMRQDVIRVVAEHGWSKNAMTQMRKVDSFVHESQRLDRLSSFSSRRVVRAPSGFMFTDGTFLPRGTTLYIASNAVHWDEKYYGEGVREFDGFRFSRMRDELDCKEGAGSASKEGAGLAAKEGAGPASKEGFGMHQMTHTTATNLTFGNGRHACPGRFFAANEIKAMLAHVLLEYDVKPKDDSVGNGGGGMEWDFNFVPSREEVLLRKRVVEGELV